MNRLASLFPRSPALIGMVHVRGLPGTPFHQNSIPEIVDIAVDEARRLHDAGFDGIIIENMHDRPYVHGGHGPEITAVMTSVAIAVRDEIGKCPLGVQVLSGGNREAVAVATVAGGAFIRCENFVFSHVADEGLLERAEAGPLLRYRRQIGEDGPGAHIAIFCDVRKKHASHAITSDIGLAEAVKAAQFFGADGVIITGVATGVPTEVIDVQAAREATSLPILAGSGVTPDTVEALAQHADGLIVGSFLKEGGLWSNPLDPDRVEAMRKAVERAQA